MEQIEIQKYIGNLTSEEFNVFISELNMIPLLTVDEEMKFIHRIRKGGHEGAQAREMLVKSNLRYIYSVAKKYKHLSLTQLLRFILVFLANQRFVFLICFTVFYKF